MLPRVLIAEPDDELRTAYGRYLTRQGFSIVTAGTLAEWLEQTTSFAPHAVVSELDFPDGLLHDHIDSVLPREGVRKPVLFLATRRNQDQASGKVCSLAQGYFVKPFAMGGLVQALQSVVPPPTPPLTG